MLVWKPSVNSHWYEESKLLELIAEETLFLLSDLDASAMLGLLVCNNFGREQKLTNNVFLSICIFYFLGSKLTIRAW